MKTCIIITTIFEPSIAINEFIKNKNKYNYDIIIVCDKKTNTRIYKTLDVILLDIEKQEQLFNAFSNVLPFNHYCRKNIGYIYAILNKYDIIYETDDDNIPYDSFYNILNNITFNNVSEIDSSSNIINIYKLFTDTVIWPRGLPLSKINNIDNFNGS